ncbi:MAG: hypothetical protein MUC50_15210 [Myxococcota bacterium]|jgi:hypothetical protein|nr:hypothetical protein [Myxococcota bacterium]
MQRIMIFAMLVCMLLAACGSSDSVEEYLAAWREAGLEPTAFEKTANSSLGSVSCQAGQVSGIHVSLCECSDEKTTATATAAGRQSIGEATGLALAKGTVLMIAIDRSNVDPSGRTLNKISKVFWSGKADQKTTTR